MPPTSAPKPMPSCGRRAPSLALLSRALHCWASQQWHPNQVLKLVLAAITALYCGHIRGEDAPFGLDKRVPWTSSRLIGSPEPPLEFTVERVYQNLALTSPIYAIEEPASDQLLIVLASTDGKQGSRIIRVSSDFATDKFEPYFELPGRLLYSLTFHPDFARNGFVYLFSNGPTGDQERNDRISRYRVPPGEHRLAPDSEQTVIEWRSMGHDGGDLVFGLDGMLYITTGDGTGDSDTWDSGQTIDDLLGSVLRIDVDHTGGALYRLVRNGTTAPPTPFPRRLSETGLFASTTEHRAADGVIPYSINAPAWHDGAAVERYLAVPGEAQVGYTSGPSWTFPDGTALVQTLSIEQSVGAPDTTAPDTSDRDAAKPPATPRRLETRVLLRQQGEWAGFSYRWDDEQNDALLVPRDGADATLPTADSAQQRSWRFPSRSECLACHSRAASFVLGLTEAQMNREHDYSSGADNQLRSLDHIGLFSGPPPKPPAELARLTDPRDPLQDIEARARAYLHVNCSVCHVAAGGGNARMELGLATPTGEMKLVGARPQHDTFGIESAMLVAPGEPDRSVLVRRLSQRGAGQMPPLVSREVDVAAVDLLRTWISQLQPARPFVRDWQLDDLTPHLEQVAARSVEAGQTLFREIGCAECHRFGGEGGSVGPNLTGIGKRLTPRDLLESLLSPAKTIADEYAVIVVATDGGQVFSGRIEREDAQTLVLRPSAAGELPIEIAVDQIAERHKSNISNMPAGTLNVLQQEEILDLLGYLLSEANADDPRFR